jgi:PQ loop repeat
MLVRLPAERPQFYEIRKHRAVLGISLLFMVIDLLGGVFSILSLVFKRQVDVLAAVAYSLVVVRPYGLNPAILSLTNIFLFGMPGL